METIIVPTDFSAASVNAAHYAAHLAGFFNARLVLVNAYPVPLASFETGFALETYNALKRSSVEKLELLQKEICEKNHRQYEIECFSEMGLPYDVINNAVEQYSGDLVVMGITGEAGIFKEHVIGSTALKVARHLPVPAFIIPDKAHYRPIRKISFACDLEKTEETDLVYEAKYFSRVFDAFLELVFVKNPREDALSDKKSKTMSFVENNLQTINHSTVQILGKDPGMDLEDYFKSHKTDVIMLSPKRHNLFHNLFNQSVTKELVFHAGLPILAIH